MKYISIVFCLLLALLSACGSSPEETENKVAETIVSDEFKVYEFDPEGPKISFFDLVEEVEIMRLEETDESLLSYVGQVIDAGDEYIFNSGKEGDIYRYTKTGEYKGKVNRRGEGPEEYSSTQSIWVNQDSIFVYSKLKKTVKQYLRNGDFVKSWGVPASGTQIMPFRKGYAMDLNSTMVDDSLAFNMMLLDKDFNRGGFYAPFKKREGFFSVSTSYNGFYEYKNDLAYIRSLSDTLFLLNDNGAKPLTKLDFGKNWLWNDAQLFEDSGAASKAMQSRGLVWNINARIHPRWLFVDYIVDFSSDKSIIIDRETGVYRHIDLEIPGKDPFSFVMIGWEGDRLFTSVSSSLVADLIGHIGEDQWGMRSGTTLEKIESSENPVLMWMKFKAIE